MLISDMLMELVRINDKIPLRDGTLTRFHSRYVEPYFPEILLDVLHDIRHHMFKSHNQ